MQHPDRCVVIRSSLGIGFAFIAALGSSACQSEGTAPTPPDVERPGLLHESELWTRPEGSLNGTSQCRVRRSVPGCELFLEPSVKDSAIEGKRLVVLMERDRLAGIAAWDLLISDDLGQTVRRFPLTGLAGDGRHARLQLFQGRIFLLSSVGSTVGAARVFEVDPVQGTLTSRGGSATLSSALATAMPAGALTAVAFARDRPPQVISLTRFDPATDSIRRDDLDCDVVGCDPDGLSQSFVSSDGELFTILVASASRPPATRTCLLTARMSTKTLSSECFPDLATDVWPVSSFGGTPYDFQFVGGDTVASLVPVSRNWIPSGARILLGSGRAHWVGDGFLLFSPTAFVTAGDTLLLRLLPGGKFQQTAVQHDGCLNLGPVLDASNCPRAFVYRALAADQLLFVTQRDEFKDETRSRQIFEIHRSAAPFAAFALP